MSNENDEKHVLFVCRYNRFRSVFAEAFFKKYNKNKKIKVKSAAPIKGRPIGDKVKQLAKEFNLKIKKHPEGLTSETMIWQNITVVVANNVPGKLFDKNKKYGKKVIVWKIPDVENDELDEMRDISKMIEKKIISLVEDFNSNRS